MERGQEIDRVRYIGMEMGLEMETGDVVRYPHMQIIIIHVPSIFVSIE
jgi:hypothetical protein